MAAKIEDQENVLILGRELTKQYGDLVAVDRVDFEVFHNECVGFLGPNGAGKTTLMRMIFSATPKSAGDLSVFGLKPMRDRKKINARVGVVFQEDNLDTELNVSECLLVYAKYCGVAPGTARQRVRELLHWLALDSKADSTIRALSGGMVRRVMIARALLNNPLLLILDEPTTGLDPQVRHSIWAALRELKRRGITILLTTHYMDEAQHLSDRVMIMDEGRIILSGPPNQLVEEHLERYVLQTSGLEEFPSLDRSIRHEQVGDADYFYSNAEAPLRELYGQIGSRDVMLRYANLEDVFLKFTGRGLHE